MFNGSAESLLALIKDGESEQVEFKTELPPDAVLARHLSAFANAKGGVLIVGVDPSGNPHGLPEHIAERTAQRLREVSTSVCEWSTRVGVTDLGGRWLVYLAIDPAPRHLAPAMTSAGEVYERRGTETVLVTGGERLRLVQQFRPKSDPKIIAMQSDRPCILFVAMSFRTEQEPALVDYFSAINRAVTETALDIVVQRMDLMEGDYEISQKLMSAIDAADIVLGDFTLNSANVYFEIGYARGKGKRIIQTTRKDTALEFDVRQWRTLVYRNATELEEKLELELRAAHRDAKRAQNSGGAA